MAAIVMIIPFTDLEPATLQGLLEDIVSRDGTDYGQHEVSLHDKVAQLKMVLKNGEQVLCFDAETGHCDVMNSSDAKSAVADSLLATD